MKKTGFTLIELVVVIVILGILAAVVTPKFIDLIGDTKSALINNISGNLHVSVFTQVQFNCTNLYRHDRRNHYRRTASISL